MEKIKDVKMRRAIFDCLYLVMFMSINPGETIELFKACGKEKMMECLIALNPVIHGPNFLGLLLPTRYVINLFPTQCLNTILTLVTLKL
jgi:Na+/glutamate symporter